MLKQDSEPGGPGIRVAGWKSVPHAGVYATLLLTSTALLMLEVSLTRFFSFTVWYHLAYLTISVALLGFGSSGAIVAAFPNLFRRRGQSLLVLALALAAVATIGALLFLSRVPMEVRSLETAIKSGEFPTQFSALLLAYYAAVGAPFLLAGFAIGVPFAAYPHLMGRLYFFDLFGAALGCVLVVALIELFTVPGLIIVAASLMLVSAMALSLGDGNRLIATLLGSLAAVGILTAAPIGLSLPITPTESKSLGNFREAINRPDAFTRWTALNRVDAWHWDPPTKITYWLGAGIKPGYKGPAPDTARLVYDGSNGSGIFSYKGSFDEYAFLDNHILRTPYLLAETPRVLVIGVGGGVDMLNAIKNGASHVTGVELQPETVYLLKEHLRQFTGGFYDRDDVTLEAGEGRHFVRKTDESFDLIEITAVDTFAAQTTGAYILAESYLYTVDAMKDYFSRLSDDGLLSMVIGDIRYRDDLPPLATRLAVNAHRALRSAGVEHPENHLMVVSAVASHGWSQTESVLVKLKPFTAADRTIMEEFTAQNGFEILYAPAAAGPAKYALSDILGPDETLRQQLINDAWFRIDAVYDDDPFFYNVARWSNFSPEKSQYFISPGSFIGQLVLVLMLAQSLLLGVILICFPLLLGAREGLKARGVFSYLIYFLTLGIGFMFIEISFIQSFVLFLGSPTYALSVTIFSLLLFSSVGSFLSSRFVDRPAWALKRVLIVLALVILAYVNGLAGLFQAFLGLPMSARVAIAVAVQVPMGLTLGMFMPLGIACVSRRHARLVPWAWGINGVGSVMGTTLAVILAMEVGFKVVSLLAVGLYVVGTTLMLRLEKTAQ